MKSRRLLAVAFALSALASLPALAAPAADPDPAVRLLGTHGIIHVHAAGPHVAVGSFRIHVRTKLGPPDLTLPDGTWLYHGRGIEGSAAQGTLIVQFAQGRVSALALATPAAVAALRAKRAPMILSQQNSR